MGVDKSVVPTAIIGKQTGDIFGDKQL